MPPARAGNIATVVGIDGTVEFGPVTDQYKKYLTMVHQWYAENLIYSDFTSRTPGMGVDDSLLVEGKVGIKARTRRASRR